MKDWELDRIHIWIRAAAIDDNEKGVRFLIDKKDKSLFNLIQKDNQWKCILNQEIAVSYSKEDIKILEQKIQFLENYQNDILEFPKLNKKEIEYIQKAKLELEEKRSNNIKFDVMEYNRIIYEQPAEFGINWLKNLEIEIEEVSRIGF